VLTMKTGPKSIGLPQTPHNTSGSLRLVRVKGNENPTTNITVQKHKKITT